MLTGATGLLGSNVAAELTQRGYHVKVLLRKSSNTIALADLPVTHCLGDITDPESIRAAMRDCQIVIHAAANTSQWGPDIAQHDAVNVQGTENVLSAIQSNDVERFIYVSTANTLAPGPLENPGDETGAFGYQSGSTPYIDTKYRAEQLVLEAVAAQGIPAVIVNPTFIIGARDAKPSSGKMILFYLRSPLVMCPPGGKNYVSASDAAMAIVNAIEYGRVGERYLLAGANLSYSDFFTKIGQVTGRQKPMLHAPAMLLRAIGRIGNVAQQFVPRPISWTYPNVSMLTIDNYYKPTKAVTELNMPQTAIENAIDDAFTWFAKHNYV